MLLLLLERTSWPGLTSLVPAIPHGAGRTDGRDKPGHDGPMHMYDT